MSQSQIIYLYGGNFEGEGFELRSWGRVIFHWAKYMCVANLSWAQFLCGCLFVCVSEYVCLCACVYVIAIYGELVLTFSLCNFKCNTASII